MNKPFFEQKQKTTRNPTLLGLSLMLINGLFWMSSPLAAADSEKNIPTIGELADRFTAGTSILTRLVLTACIVIGLIMVFSAFSYYKAHRANPKFAPLDRPIFYLLFGIVLLCIPFLKDIIGPTGSVLELKKNQKQTQGQDQTQKHESRIPPGTVEIERIDIDAPLELGNEYDH